MARGYAKKTALGDNALLVCKEAWGKPGTVTGIVAIDTNKMDLSMKKYGEWVAAAIPYEFGIIPVYAVQFYARCQYGKKDGECCSHSRSHSHKKGSKVTAANAMK